jgi:hypothetical protein
VKTKTAVGITVLACAVMTGSYWAGVEHDKNRRSRIRINAVSNLKQVGLSFRSYRNDITRFTATGAVTATKVPVEGR